MTEQRILVVLDKDGTLTESVSGSNFPTAPTDQKLIRGVPEALALLRDDRYSLAIASNQGGCDVFTVQASQIKIGDYIVHGKDDRFKVTIIDTAFDGGLIFRYDRERPNSKEYSFSFPDSDVRVSYKTIESAIEEVKYAAKLTDIELALFCPKMDGSQAVVCDHIQRYCFGAPTSKEWYVERIGSDDLSENFRKPDGGMLKMAQEILEDDCCDEFTHYVMIGDRPEDRAAANAAGFIFLDASEWRSGVTAEQAIDRAKVAI